MNNTKYKLYDILNIAINGIMHKAKIFEINCYYKYKYGLFLEDIGEIIFLNETELDELIIKEC